MSLCRPVVQKTPGVVPSVVIAVIAVSGKVLSLVNYRLYWRCCRCLASLVRGRGYSCVVALDDDCHMVVSLDDPYWSRLISESYEYEADFRRVLQQLDDIAYDIIDCGANFGYWSIVLSGQAMGGRNVLAVEPMPDTYNTLLLNKELNGRRFRCVRYAVSSSSGDTVTLQGTAYHSDVSIRREPPVAGNAPAVTTITLDDLVRRYYKRAPDRLLIKLDVEGEEINALIGAKEVLTRDVLFYYEDHGRDGACSVTRFVLEQLGLKVYFCHPDGHLIPITSVAAAASVKRQDNVGYNFEACSENSAFLQALQKLC
jgi:FkbM family methyltransferase